MNNQILALDNAYRGPTGYQKLNDFDYTFVKDVETVIEHLQQAPFNLLLIADTITETDDLKLRKIALIFNEDILFLKAGTSPLPVATIHQMLARQPKEERRQYTFVDDALKNASFNIIIQ